MAHYLLIDENSGLQECDMNVCSKTFVIWSLFSKVPYGYLLRFYKNYRTQELDNKGLPEQHRIHFNT